ncbi:MAG TPA: peptidoglycan bridge formation glycyltransferase FemA/FemB family protein [Candidatus Saccharimonadales bacterium]|nr:peptidoglycan bridge formation glycyltransferase FemA/FemB family protein [Candidatus Saccharimonadales bacterium]
MLSSSEHKFLSSCPITQTDEWAEFQKALGKDAVRLKGKGWSCLLIRQSTKLGDYWLTPYGPFLKDKDVLPEALGTIRTEAKRRSLSWVSVEPFGNGLYYNARKLGLKKAGKAYNPAYTVVNDLSLAEAKRWSALSATFRNLINRAEKRGLSFRTSTEPKDIKLFTDMLGEVASRKKISLHNADYFKKQAEILMPKGAAFLELAYYEKKPVAGAIILQSGKVGHYAYAGSHPEARKAEAGTVLVWQAMQNALGRGVRWFDLFGVAPPGAPTSHPWAGFSTFKRKFGGEDIALGGTWHLPVNPGRYRAYRASLPLMRRLQKIR